MNKMIQAICWLAIAGLLVSSLPLIILGVTGVAYMANSSLSIETMTVGMALVGPLVGTLILIAVVRMIQIRAQRPRFTVKRRAIA